MANKKAVSTVAVLLSSVLLLLCTGCDFNTKIISGSPKPQAVLTSFFTKLKEGSYQECDQYLADNVSFAVKDTSEYDFLDALVALETENLEYEFIGDTSYKGVIASQEVKITTIDINKMTEYMKANVSDTVYQYLVNEGEKTFDKENPEHISGAIKLAMNDFLENVSDKDLAVSTITVNLKYEDGKWLIQADEQLISAVFGETTDTAEAVESEEASDEDDSAVSEDKSEDEASEENKKDKNKSEENKSKK